MLQVPVESNRHQDHVQHDCGHEALYYELRLQHVRYKTKIHARCLQFHISYLLVCALNIEIN